MLSRRHSGICPLHLVHHLVEVLKVGDDVLLEQVDALTPHTRVRLSVPVVFAAVYQELTILGAALYSPRCSFATSASHAFHEMLLSI